MTDATALPDVPDSREHVSGDVAGVTIVSRVVEFLDNSSDPEESFDKQKTPDAVRLYDDELGNAYIFDWPADKVGRLVLTLDRPASASSGIQVQQVLGRCRDDTYTPLIFLAKKDTQGRTELIVLLDPRNPDLHLSTLLSDKPERNETKYVPIHIKIKFVIDMHPGNVFRLEETVYCQTQRKGQSAPSELARKERSGMQTQTDTSPVIDEEGSGKHEAPSLTLESIDRQTPAVPSSAVVHPSAVTSVSNA